MQDKRVICPAYDNVCQGCSHGKPHNRDYSCGKGCHDGIICVDYLKYSRKEKLNNVVQ